MYKNLVSKLSLGGSLTLLVASSVIAQEHPWAGRTLDNFEWAVHERLAALPSNGVFDTISFEIRDKTVILAGQVTNENASRKAERAVRNMEGVATVVNHIEILPPSRRDDVLRKTLYRAIYEDRIAEKDPPQITPSVHIIVKNGWASLEGVVASDADREAVRLRAMKVTAHISDHIRVAPGDK